MPRPTHCTEYLRHNFTDKEKLEMGSQLAGAHSRLASLKEEQEAATANFNDRKKQLVAEVGRLSRLYEAGFDMQNVRCRMEWDKPNANEVSIVREDNGETIKVRPFSESERQAELPLTNREGEVEVIPPEKPEAEAEKAIEASQAAVDGYFDHVMCKECEKKFPASAIVKTSDDIDLCPECFRNQGPASDAEPVEVEMPEVEAEEAVTEEMNF
jgi:hypothetical protein